MKTSKALVLRSHCSSWQVPGKASKPFNLCFYFLVKLYSLGIPYCPCLYVHLTNAGTHVLSTYSETVPRNLREIRRTETAREEMVASIIELNSTAWDFTGILCRNYQKWKEGSYLTTFFVQKSCTLHVNYLPFSCDNKLVSPFIAYRWLKQELTRKLQNFSICFACMCFVI